MLKWQVAMLLNIEFIQNTFLCGLIPPCLCMQFMARPYLPFVDVEFMNFFFSIHLPLLANLLSKKV